MSTNLKKKSITLLHGQFDKAALDLLAKRKVNDVFLLEGRPSLESSKKMSQELLRRKIKPTIIADNMAGFLFYQNMVKEIFGAYQIADKNGAVCQIGTLILAVLGNKHKVPVSLFPAKAKTELMGKPKDIMQFNGQKVAPKNIHGYVPLVEWVPKKYIQKIYE